MAQERKPGPKHAISTHKLDYCDTCAKVKVQPQTTLNRIRQSGSASIAEQNDLETRISSLTTDLEIHKDEAHQSHQYYLDTTKRCQEEWDLISTLESKEDKTEEELSTLGTLKHGFTLTLSADYQMQKLVPYWEFSPQPGSTYYCQKLSHNIYGIVDHRDRTCMIYIFDETAGPKSADHSVSYLVNYIEKSGRIPVWVRRIHLYLDNAGSTNKNAYFMAWAMEYVEQEKVD